MVLQGAPNSCTARHLKRKMHIFTKCRSKDGTYKRRNASISHIGLVHKSESALSIINNANKQLDTINTFLLPQRIYAMTFIHEKRRPPSSHGNQTQPRTRNTETKKNTNQNEQTHIQLVLQISHVKHKYGGFQCASLSNSHLYLPAPTTTRSNARTHAHTDRRSESQRKQHQYHIDNNNNNNNDATLAASFKRCGSDKCLKGNQ